MEKIGTEASTVQYPIIRYAVDIDWEYLKPEEALYLRGGEGGLLLKEIFLTQIQRLNLGIVDYTRTENLAKRITRVLPRIEGTFEAWKYPKCRIIIILEPKINNPLTIM